MNNKLEVNNGLSNKKDLPSVILREPSLYTARAKAQIYLGTKIMEEKMKVEKVEDVKPVLLTLIEDTDSKHHRHKDAQIYQCICGLKKPLWVFNKYGCGKCRKQISKLSSSTIDNAS